MRRKTSFNGLGSIGFSGWRGVQLEMLRGSEPGGFMIIHCINEGDSKVRTVKNDFKSIYYIAFNCFRGLHVVVDEKLHTLILLAVAYGKNE